MIAAPGLRCALDAITPRFCSTYLRTDEADAGLLLVADQRQMRVEQIMRRVALAGLLTD